MIYVYPFTIPANTAASAKIGAVLPLCFGRITEINVHFPSGCMGLVHVHLNRGLYQVAPANPDETFASSDETIDWDESFDLVAAPFQLEVYGWNEDDTWQHTITIRIVIVREARPGGEAITLLAPLITGVPEELPPPPPPAPSFPDPFAGQVVYPNSYEVNFALPATPWSSLTDAALRAELERQYPTVVWEVVGRTEIGGLWTVVARFGTPEAGPYAADVLPQELLTPWPF